MTANLALKPIESSKPLTVSIDRGVLLKALAHVQSVVERRNTIPILSNILISAADGSLQLSATDMDIDIIEQVDAKVEVSGATTVPALTFYDIIRKLPEGADIKLDNTDNNGRLTVKAGRSKFALATLPIEDFPSTSQVEYSHQFELDASELRRLIDRTRFAISTEETRYYLNGIYMHATQNNGVDVLRVVSTDGHRLARLEIPMPEGASGMPGIIIPRKTVLELRKLIDETEDTIGISLSDNRIRFAFQNIVLSSKLIDGTFPDYSRVIPTDNDKNLDVDAKVLADAVDRVSTISSEKSRAIKLSLEKGRLVLSAQSPDQGSASEELEVAYQSDAIEIGFNSRYLMDCLQQIDGEVSQLVFADGVSPAIIQDAADKSALYVLMPMRV